jgi:hypothetical protein
VVVCSRYEKEGEPLSMIRTCQELDVDSLTVESWAFVAESSISTSGGSRMSWRSPAQRKLSNGRV